VLTNQFLIETYRDIEKQRKELKAHWFWLKENGGDKEEIKIIGRKLTQLTLKQAHILIELELKQ